MILEYSFWWIIPLIIISGLGSYILYHRSKESIFNKRQRAILSVIRFLTIFLVLFLILSPIHRTKTNRYEKPIIAILQDNSSSIIKGKDSTYYTNTHIKELKKLYSELSKDFEPKLYSFGNSSSLVDEKSIDNKIVYNDWATDINNALEDVLDKNYNSNLSGIVLLSDGIINKGISPISFAQNNDIPIISVGLGDSTEKKDLYISNIRYNKVSYLKNIFPVEVLINAQKAKGSKSRISVSNQGRVLFQENFEIDEEQFHKVFNIALESENPGVNRYRISLEKIDGEENIINNTRDIFIEIIDTRQKILLLASSPHPDISSIKQSLESSEVYEIRSETYSGLPKDIEEQSLVILHQIPNNNPQSIDDIKKIRSMNIPILYIIGQGSNINSFNSLNSGIRISSQGQAANQSFPELNQGFTQFNISESTKDIIKHFPPLASPFGNYNISENVHTFAYQKISSISTKYPLISFSTNTENKEGFFFGDGIWRWRLSNYSENQTHNEFNEILSKTIQYLTINRNLKPLKLIYEDVYSENQPVLIDAELYNESFELINTPDIELSIIDKDNKKYEYIFGKTSNAYHINCGLLPNGEYSIIAKTNLSSKEIIERGSFIISELNLEELNLKSDFNLLFNLSNISSGRFFAKEDMGDIKDFLSSSNKHKTIIHTDISKTKLINSWWYLSIIILLLALEWLLRKLFI